MLRCPVHPAEGHTEAKEVLIVHPLPTLLLRRGSILLKATQRLRRSSSYILFLHFSYAVGATLSPLWARFFVSKKTLQTPSNLTCADALLLPLTTDNPVCSLALNATCPHNSSNVSLSDLEKYLCVSSPHPSLLFGWAYWLCAPIFLTALGAFVYYWIKYEPIGCRRTRSEFPSRGQEGLSTTSVPHKQTGTAYFLSSQPLHIKIIFFLLLSLFCYIYIGIEAFFTNYLFTFSVESGTFTKDTAAILNSLFWATFAVFRFIAILLALMKFPTALQIVTNISGGADHVHHTGNISAGGGGGVGGSRPHRCVHVLHVPLHCGLASSADRDERQGVRSPDLHGDPGQHDHAPHCGNADDEGHTLLVCVLHCCGVCGFPFPGGHLVCLHLVKKTLVDEATGW